MLQIPLVVWGDDCICITNFNFLVSENWGLKVLVTSFRKTLSTEILIDAIVVLLKYINDKIVSSWGISFDEFESCPLDNLAFDNRRF